MYCRIMILFLILGHCITIRPVDRKILRELIRIRNILRNHFREDVGETLTTTDNNNLGTTTSSPDIGSTTLSFQQERAARRRANEMRLIQPYVGPPLPQVNVRNIDEEPVVEFRPRNDLIEVNDEVGSTDNWISKLILERADEFCESSVNQNKCLQRLLGRAFA